MSVVCCSPGHACRAVCARRGVMRRAGDRLAWPVVAGLLLLAWPADAAASDQLAPGSEYSFHHSHVTSRPG